MLHALQQHLVLGIARLSHTGYIDAGLVFDGAFVLTNPTAHTQLRINVGLLHENLLPRLIDDFNLLDPDRFGRRGTVLLAHDTGAGRSIGKAAVLVYERLSDLDLLFFLQRQLTDGIRRAHLTAERALVFTVSNVHIQYRRPQPFDSSFQPGRLDGVRGAHLHAFAAANTAAQKLRFRNGPGRSNQSRIKNAA